MTFVHNLQNTCKPPLLRCLPSCRITLLRNEGHTKTGGTHAHAHAHTTWWHYERSSCFRITIHFLPHRKHTGSSENAALQFVRRSGTHNNHLLIIINIRIWASPCTHCVVWFSEETVTICQNSITRLVFLTYRVFLTGRNPVLIQSLH